jgi:O-antigen/teichoic acid export membrane protein
VLRGPTGAMLLMTDNAAISLKLTLAGLALLLLLSFALIPRLGLIGAAIAYSAPIILRCLLGYVIARRLLAP